MLTLACIYNLSSQQQQHEIHHQVLIPMNLRFVSTHLSLDTRCSIIFKNPGSPQLYIPQSIAAYPRFHDAEKREGGTIRRGGPQYQNNTERKSSAIYIYIGVQSGEDFLGARGARNLHSRVFAQ